MTKLLITIDTEENWEGPGSSKKPDVSNIYMIPELQKNVFDKLNIHPVYLVTYPVAADPRSALLLSEISGSGKCEIGAHLHNWNSPPFTEKDVIEKSYQFRLPYAIEKQKIAGLTQIIKQNLKTCPHIFRAGRWGADGETIKILAELGYKIDVSVAPLADYTGEGGMDFYDAPFNPYFPSFDNITNPVSGNSGKVLEIPVTCGFSHPDFEKIKRLYRILSKNPIKYLRLIGLLYGLNILKKIKLSPEVATFEEMKKLVDVCLSRDCEVLHLTFHSSMNSVWHSPYSKDEEERDARIRNLKDILNYIVNQKNINSYTANDIYKDRRG